MRWGSCRTFGVKEVLKLSCVCFFVCSLPPPGSKPTGKVSEFISLWNRSLWVLIFVLPVHLGKFVVPVIMSGINCVTAYSIYGFGKAKKLSNTWLLISLLLFQPFFFGVGRDAMTEPLAACLIALGLLFWARKHFWAFVVVVVGALLPLARLELVLLLPLWGMILVQEKKRKPILELSSGLIALVVEDYSKAIALNPDFTPAFMNRGSCYLELGIRKKACADLTIAYKQGNSEALEFINTYC